LFTSCCHYGAGPGSTYPRSPLPAKGIILDNNCFPFAPQDVLKYTLSEEASNQEEPNFSGATFTEKADFSGATFRRENFDGANFKGQAVFLGVTFTREVDFHGYDFLRVDFD